MASTSTVKSTGGTLADIITIDMIQKEYITHEKDDHDAWHCICGNTPASDGFYPCDEAGNEMEPADGWKNLYVCNRCGRIIQQDSLQIIGRKLNHNQDGKKI